MGKGIIEELGVSADDVEFVGGMRWSIFGQGTGGNASWPLVRLHITSDSLSLNPNGLARYIPFIPSYTFSWSNIIRAEYLHRGGVRFILRRGQPIIFWSFVPRHVLDTLEARGVLVDRNPRSAYPRL